MLHRTCQYRLTPCCWWEAQGNVRCHTVFLTCNGSVHKEAVAGCQYNQFTLVQGFDAYDIRADPHVISSMIAASLSVTTMVPLPVPNQICRPARADRRRALTFRGCLRGRPAPVASSACDPEEAVIGEDPHCAAAVLADEVYGRGRGGTVAETNLLFYNQMKMPMRLP